MEKLNRYSFDTHKKRYLVGRALIRTILSRCNGLAPTQIVLSREDHGRPYLVQSGRGSPPQFNLSYPDGLLTVALTLDCRVGIYVENISSKIECLEIAGRYFLPADHKELEQLTEHLHKEPFFELLTLKEAYAKAQGRGVNIPLNEVSFHLRGERSDYSKSSSVVTVDDRQWQLRSLKPSDLYSTSIYIQDANVPFKVISKKGSRWKQKMTSYS